MAEAFTDTTLVASGWCSRGDCKDTLQNIEEYVEPKNETAHLNRAILSATDHAQSVLRTRWPDDDWPFNTPGAALRRRVAVIAVFEVFAGSALADELAPLIAAKEEAEDWLEGVRDKTISLSTTTEAQTATQIAVTGPPLWKNTTYGFRHAADD